MYGLTQMQYNLWHYVYGAIVRMSGIKIMNWEGEVNTDWTHSVDTREVANLLTLEDGPEEFRGKDIRSVQEEVEVVIDAMEDAGLVETVIYGPGCNQKGVELPSLVGVFTIKEEEVPYYKNWLRLASVPKIKPNP